ncbi:MAG: hypothetical protein DHS20C19_24950 [Acidimicrobiales bacterium]|nr:MAG: hypothetical protein DHS20C19_24950 [Acidimicrobiales bacterium]
MRILLMTQNDDQFLEAAVPLRRRGHEVVACHDQGAAESRWPCVAVESTCPLDDGVDAAVVLSRCEHRPEEGVSCVVRHRVPLVVGGPTPVSVLPYADAVIDGIDDTLADIVETAVARPHPLLSIAATEAVVGAAKRAGVEGDVHADVYRRRRDLDVMVRGIPETDTAARTRCAQAAFAAVRKAVPGGTADTINVGASTS